MACCSVTFTFYACIIYIITFFLGSGMYDVSDYQCFLRLPCNLLPTIIPDNQEYTV